MLERLLERPGTTRIARPAHDVIAAVGAVTASRASHVLAVVLKLMSAGSESGGARSLVKELIGGVQGEKFLGNTQER